MPEILEPRRVLNGDALAFVIGGLGTSDQVDSWRIAADEVDNIYIAGRFRGTVDFNPANGVSSSPDGVEVFQSSSGGIEPYDAFVVKYDATGAFQWADVAGGYGHQSVTQLGLDDAGNIYLLGDRTDYSPTLRKLTQDGGGVSQAWSYPLPLQYASGFAVSPGGNAFAETHGSGPTRFDISSVSPDGTLVATTTVTGSSVQATSLDVKADGNLLVAGNFASSVSLGSHTLNSVGGRDTFVAELDVTTNPSSPVWLWALALGTADANDGGAGITESQDGSLRLTSSHYVTDNNVDLLVRRLEDVNEATPEPEVIWTTAFDVPASTSSAGFSANLQTDAAGNVYLGGLFGGTIQFGPGDFVPSAGERDVFTAKLDASGNLVWHTTAGDATRQDLGEVVLDSANHVFATVTGSGSFDVPATVDGATVTPVNLGSLPQRSGLVWRLTQPSAAAPELQVDFGGEELAPGAVVGLGATDIGAPVQATFHVRNRGNDTLVLDAPSLAASLTYLPEFSLVASFGSTTLAPDDGEMGGPDETTFVIQYDASAPGAATGTISFHSNDADEDPFSFVLEAAALPPSWIIDNGDPGFVATGFTPFPYGYLNDVHYTLGDDSGDQATWTFVDLPAGVYRVSATWTAHSNRAFDATYELRDGGTSRGDWSIDQRQPPSDFTDAGASWNNLGPYARVSSGTLTVTLSDDANGVVVADAVRLEFLEAISVDDPELQVVHGNALLAPGDTIAFGAAAVPITREFSVRNEGGAALSLGAVTSSSADFTVAGGNTIVEAGSAITVTVTMTAEHPGAVTSTISIASNDANDDPFTFDVSGEVLTFTTQIVDDGDPGFESSGFTAWGHGFRNDLHYAVGDGSGDFARWTFDGLPTGLYRVSAFWSANSDRGSNVSFTLRDGPDELRVVQVDQKTAPADLQDEGVWWGDLGAYARVVSGTLVVEVDGNANGLVDADAIRIEWLAPVVAGVPEIQVSSDGQNVLSGATMDFGRLTGPIDRSFTIRNEGGGPLTLGAATSTSGDFVATHGATSLEAGAATTLTVSVSDTASGLVSSVITIPNNDPDEAPFVFTVVATVGVPLIIDDGDAGFSAPVGYTRWTGQGFQSDVREAYATSGAVDHTATWTFEEVPTGVYRVSATWTAYPNRASNSPFSINGGVAVPINQKLPPSDVAATPLNSVLQDPATGWWFADLSQTAVPIDGSIVVVLSTDRANGNLNADAIRLERIGPLPFMSPLTSALDVTGAPTATGDDAVFAATTLTMLSNSILDLSAPAVGEASWDDLAAVAPTPGDEASSETWLDALAPPTDENEQLAALDEVFAELDPLNDLAGMP